MYKKTAICVYFFIASPAFGQSVTEASKAEGGNEATQKVVVSSAKSDLEIGREFAAGKIVIGKTQIAQSGVQNVSDLLKRDPSITVGKDGRISLLSMPGYTQILLNGEKTTNRDPLELDLSEVERIEIIKSSTAETGPFGLAGTINIITRKADRIKSRQVSAGASTTAGSHSFNGAWSLNEVAINDPAQFRVSINLSQKNSLTPSLFMQTDRSSEGVATSAFTGSGSNASAFDLISLSSGINYKLDSQRTLSFTPSAGNFKLITRDNERRNYNQKFDWQSKVVSTGGMFGYDLPIVISQKIDDFSTFDIDARFGRNKVHNQYDSTNTNQTVSNEYRSSESSNFIDTYKLGVKYQLDVDNVHDIVIGAHWQNRNSKIQNRSWLNGTPDLNLASFGLTTELETSTTRFYAQDEWRVSKTVAANLGVSAEDSRITMSESSATTFVNYRVWSPSVHLSKKLDSDTRRRVRISLARNFQEPDSTNLLARPSINSLAPCQSNRNCRPNSVDTPDIAGNPNLKVERAVAFNIAYDHGLTDNSQIGTELYLRKIDQKLARDIALDSVSWSEVPRYVDRPVNIGNAEIFGFNFDWRLSASDLFKSMPKIDLRGSLGRSWSTVSNLAQPDNHLEGQTPWRAKLGLTYQMSNAPIRLNADANWLPSDWVRNSQAKRTYESRYASFSLNSIWTIDRSMSMTMSVNNFLSPKRYEIREYFSGSNLTQRQSEKPSYMQIGLRLDMKL